MTIVARNIIPPVSLATARSTLDDFLNSSKPEHPLPDHLRAIVQRERDTVDDKLAVLDNIERFAPATPGPVLALLINQPTAPVSDDDLPEWVRTVMHTTKQPQRVHPALWAILVLVTAIGTGVIVAVRGFNPLMLSPIIMVVIAATWMRLPSDAPRYQQITFDDALALARYHRERRATNPSNSRLRLRTPAESRPGPMAGFFGGERLSSERATVPDCGVSESASLPQSPYGTTRPNRAQRIAEVHAAVDELDQEWLEYKLDLHAWFLAKPQLRNRRDPVITAYREAYATLRDKAEELTDAATEDQIAAAQHAARTALKAWGDANTHALALGVSNLSPSEEAALSRLHGLVSQLNDRATPKAMWPQLIDAITRSMAKLTTVPFALGDLATLPVIAAESRLRELTMG